MTNAALCPPHTSTVPPAPRWSRPAKAASYGGMSLTTFWRLARENENFPPLARPSPNITLIDLNLLDQFLTRQAK